ncbi:helix-turn-helix transcriptional regulator [Clostridium tarantellae]|uniref:Helix-turn-helix domain-containing protein n=1 Tax=Clostridium tarantellae TaxID=39493 RepID=A0A6I1MHI1_9CLOT|nr:helix-turn-helix transcriptional regulator [Clostridium tarantellae]MPQ42855.1 helix-turn-helix domain-containing protein [Clostridium tarantellae]
MENILGQRIKQYRKDSNIKQGELAENLGVGRSTLSQIENGLIPGSLDFLYKLSKVTNKPMTFWIDEKNIEETEIPEMSSLLILADALHEAGVIKKDGRIPEKYRDKFILLLQKELEIRYLEDETS